MENLSSSRMRFLTAAAAFIVVVVALMVLHGAAALFIPIVLAVVLWYILVTIASYYQRIQIRNTHISFGIAVLLAILTVFFVFLLLIEIIRDNIAEFIASLPVYQEKLQSLMLKADKMPFVSGIDIKELGSQIDLSAVASAIVGGVKTLTSYTAATMLYTLFILLECKGFDTKIDKLFPNAGKRKKVSGIIQRINSQIQEYIRIQTFDSALTAALVYVVLLLFGVQYAAFWALLTFGLNFIPTIGSMIASVLPPLFALIQFESVVLVLILTAIICAIQFSIGNVLQPRLMGSSLNLSPLAILIGLALWGTIWGIPGMFLCIPILVIMNIIFANFSSTYWISVLLSGNKKVS